MVMLIPAGEPREVAQCYQVGANSCVQKPVEFGRFYQTLQAIGRYWLQQNVTVAGLGPALPGAREAAAGQGG